MLFKSLSHADGKLDGAIIERLLGDGMTLASCLQLALFSRIGLQQFVEVRLVTPVAIVVVVGDVAGIGVTNYGVTPSGKIDEIPSGLRAEKLCRALNRIGKFVPTASQS